MGTETLYEYLERIANLVRTDVRRSSSGLQPIQMEALHYLSRCNRYSNTPIAVAEFLGLTKGTVSQTLGVLETNRLIEKQADAHDRRVVHLSLTKLGEELVSETLPPPLLKSAFADLPESELRAATKSLDMILHRLQRANQLKTFGACKTCRHHIVEADGSRRCGLTRETLSNIDADKICREHGLDT